MYVITKEFHFSASHQLNGLPDSHPCSRLHGHNYVITLALKAEELNSVGFVVDYRDLEQFKTYLDANYDHRHLNDVLPMNPTAENMARFFFNTAADTLPSGIAIESVTVQETPKTSATYSRKDM